MYVCRRLRIALEKDEIEYISISYYKPEEGSRNNYGNVVILINI
jgi:hypothetical protein